MATYDGQHGHTPAGPNVTVRLNRECDRLIGKRGGWYQSAGPR